MRPKILIKWPVLIVSIVGIVCFSLIVFFLTENHSSNTQLLSEIKSQPLQSLNLVESIENTALSEPVNPGLPVRLNIPKIEVVTNLESLGLTSQGAVDVPKGPSNAAWFNLGPRPGQIGSAVISGHYGRWKNGSGSVFDRLYELSQGDKIFVEDDKGGIISFVVREIRRYDPAEVAPEVFASTDGQSHLNLITCEGEWNKDSQSFSKRLVVFTDKEGIN